MAARQLGRARGEARRVSAGPSEAACSLRRIATALLPRVSAGTAAPFLTAAVAVTGLGAADGGYFPAEWGLATLGFVLVAAGALLLTEPERPRGLALAFLTGLLMLALWAGLSALWSPGAHTPVLEAERGLVYVAAAAAGLLVVRTSAGAGALLAGVLAGTVALSLYALGTRLFPGHLGGAYDPSSGYQLAEPLGYWNALGLLVVIGLAVALGLAAHGETLATRAFAAVALTALLPTLYFTFSRGALVGLAVALVVQVGLDRHRGRLVVSGIVLGAPAALGVLWASDHHALTAPGATLQTAQAEGAHLTWRLAVLSLVAAALVPLLVLAERRVRPTPAASRRLAAAAAVAALAVTVAVIVVAGGPVSVVERGVDSFSEPLPTGTGDLEGRFLSVSGNGRSDYWRVAGGMVRDEPLLGGGAGSFERAWLRERPTSFYARDAHNLYLEILAELGPVGLLVLGATLALPLAALRRGRRATFAAAGASAYVAFLVHAAVDWHWEVPGVAVPALLCGVALLVWGRGESAPFGPRERRYALAFAVPLTALALVAHVGNRAVAASEDATAAGSTADGAAHARRARTWAPWSHRPHQLLGEARLARREDEAARESLRRALELDGEDWSIWYDLALVTEGAAREHALAQAGRLNPLSPELADLLTDS